MAIETKVTCRRYPFVLYLPRDSLSQKLKADEGHNDKERRLVTLHGLYGQLSTIGLKT